MLYVMFNGTKERNDIHTPVVIETLVFVGTNTSGKLFGNRFVNRETPLPIGGNGGAQQPAITVLYDKGRRVRK